MKPFLKIEPITAGEDKGSFTDIPNWIDMMRGSPVCQKVGLSHIRFPVDSQQYNPDAQRAAFNYFSSATHPNIVLNESIIFSEAYSVQGVRAIPSVTPAFPHREANLLVAPVAIHEPGIKGLGAEAFKLGENSREIIFQGSGHKEMYSYVNYAASNKGPLV
jgi:hypothetical protein